MSAETQDVIDALRRRYPAKKGWATVAEVAVGGGLGAYRVGDAVLSSSQRIDFFAVGTWPTNNFERIAFEVKVSRSDFLREMASPSKREAAMLLSSRFFFAAPKGLIYPDEVPDGCGLLAMTCRGFTQELAAPVRNEPPLPAAFVASLVRTATDQRSMGWWCGADGCSNRGGLPRRIGRARVSLCPEHDQPAGDDRNVAADG